MQLAPVPAPAFDPAIKHPANDIPNWSTREPVTAGNLHVAPRGAFSTLDAFAMKAGVVGDPHGNASYGDAIAAVQQLVQPGGPAIGLVCQDGKFFGHEIWTYSQHVVPLEPSTRLSGSTITDYQPLPGVAVGPGALDSFSATNPRLVAIVGAKHVIESTDFS